MSKLSKLGVFVICLSVLTSVTFAQNTTEYVVKTEKLNDHLYLLKSMVFSTPSTMLLSIGKDGVLLVDTGLKETNASLKKVVDSLSSGRKVDFIINTHAHKDHTGGNRAFDIQPIVIAHDLVRKTLTSGEYVLEGYKDAGLPVISFTDSMTVYFNGDEIKLIAIPGSQTNHDIVAYFKESKIVCMGDILYGSSFPAAGQTGSALMYDDCLQKALDIFPKDVTFIAGHGEPCNYEKLQAIYDMVSQTILIAQKNMAEGKSYQEMIDAKIFDEWEEVYGQTEMTSAGWIYSIYASEKGIKSKKSLIEPLYLALNNEGPEAVCKLYTKFKETKDKDEYAIGTYYFSMLGENLLYHNRAKEALVLYLFKYKQTPDSWLPAFEVGFCYLELKDKENAKKYLDIAKELANDPNNFYINDGYERLKGI